MSDKKLVLFDTDIGSDIDDAVALAYLLNQPRCELLGITTVTGEPVKRASLASALCLAAGRPQIPIYPGAAQPLLIEQQQKNCPQAAVLQNWPHAKEFPANQAIRFMQDTIHNHPGEVTLLAVGPLTNIGLLFATDPEIPGLLKELVLMCGVFTQRGVEWNAMCDPHASAIVYNAKVAKHVSFGLDVTQQCRMPAAECRERLRGGVLDIVREAAEVWFNHASVITFHDPLAAACVFAPELCEYAEGRVDVELQSQRLQGMTHWVSQVQTRPHQIAIRVDPARFFNHYFSVITR